MKNRSFALLLICLVSLVNVPHFYNVSGQQTLDFVILYDEAHGQYFNRSLMKTALDSLTNITINDPEVEININILFQTESHFNSTNLQGIDLLIFSNPGIEPENSFTTTEKDAILDFIELGGSLFFLSNPLTHNISISGHLATINDLLTERNNLLTSARFMPGVRQTESRVIIDDFNNTFDNSSFIVLNEYNMTKTIFDQNIEFFSQEKKIDNLTLYSSPISLGNERPETPTPSQQSLYLGITPSTSYAVDENYDIFRDSTTGFLTWLLGKRIGDSRLVMSGSTIMFSDLEIAENEAWVEQNQNLDLWNNLILWLLKYTPHPVRKPPAVWVFENYALIVAAISVAVFGVSLLLYKVRNKRRTSVKIN